MRSVKATLCAVGLVVACGGGPTDPEPLTGELLAGGGEADGTGFVALEDFDDAALVPGAQGGFHVWLNVRAQGVAGPVYLEREARRASDGTLILAATRQALDIPQAAMQDWWESPNAAASFMCPSPIGIQVYDEPIEFHVLLTDRDGEPLAEDFIILTPRCPSGDQQAFCENICGG